MCIFVALLFRKLQLYFTLTNILTVICTILTGWLSYDLFVDFLVDKPTTTSQKQIDFHRGLFPDIFVCRTPAIDEKMAQAFGYQPDYFWEGRSGGWFNGSFVGWNGLDGKQNFKDVLNKLFKARCHKLFCEWKATNMDRDNLFSGWGSAYSYFQSSPRKKE